MSVAPQAEHPLYITVAVLSSDGQISILSPSDTLIEPGQGLTLGNELTGEPPVGEYDYFVAFASARPNDISSLAWNVDEPATQARAAPAGALARTLERFVSGAPRSRDASTTDAPWSMTVLTTRVESNPAFVSEVGAREYGVVHFDIRPYYPLRASTPLHRVLEVADSLARSSGTDGYPYKQHAWAHEQDWSSNSDAGNLREGIDCSRAIWFAFTRAAVPYNRTNRYVATTEMSQAAAPMTDQFDSCMGAPLHTGDVVVYRDATRNDGHVVMVIDPDVRIAWGSHGWDGNPNPDTGVEYQRIKNRGDWSHWDRPTMSMVACWRHRQFSRDFLAPTGRPGNMADARPCRDQCPIPH